MSPKRYWFRIKYTTFILFLSQYFKEGEDSTPLRIYLIIIYMNIGKTILSRGDVKRNYLCPMLFPCGSDFGVTPAGSGSFCVNSPAGLSKWGNERQLCNERRLSRERDMYSRGGL